MMITLTKEECSMR